MSKQKQAETPQTPTDSNALIDAKIENLKQLQLRGVNPWPYRFDVTAHAAELQKKYAHLTNGQETQDVVSVAGRIMSHRNSGMFIDLRDSTGKIQIFSHKDHVPPELLEQMA
jgi:lysyl-tRNA synthetase class 2